MEFPEVKIHVVPGGILPKRQTAGSVGYDVCIRAIVSPTAYDRENPYMREALFDFTSMPTGLIGMGHVYEAPRRVPGESSASELVWRLNPGESVLCGIGIVIETAMPMYSTLMPRSGLTSVQRLTLCNAGIPIDPDFRGEPVADIRNDGAEPFDFTYGMRIAQLMFKAAILPQLRVAGRYEDLTPTGRGTNGLGSTGFGP